MAPFPKVGWIISLKFTDYQNKLFKANPDIWETVSEFTFHEDSAPDDLNVGGRKYVQVINVRNDTAQVVNFHPGRDDQLLPGGSLVIDIEERSTEGYSEYEIHSFPYIDTVRVYGDVPVSVLSVPIIAASPRDGYAVSDITHYEWPDGGECVDVFTNQGNSKVRSLEHGYEFPIDQPAPITGVAQVKSQYQDRQLVGSIQNFETDWPEVGDIVSAELDYSRVENIAWYGEYEDRIQIGSYPPVSGTAQVRITQATHPIKGEVVEPPESKPEVGDTVVANILGTQGSKYANPERIDARISLENESQKGGRATIEITEVSELIRGKVLAYEGTPSVGDIIAVDTSRGKAPVTGESATGSPVRIEENVLTSGKIDVRVTGGEGILTGVVESYRNRLPEVGETVSAIIDSGVSISTAHPDIGTYIIYLEDTVDYEGSAMVQITDIDGRIEGKIVEQNLVKQSVDSDSGDSPFQDENSSWNITRKKH